MMPSPFSQAAASLPIFSRKNIVAWCLLALLLTSWAVRANDPETDYTSVYITITAADDLNKKGDFVKARVKYLEAQKELQAFQQANPTWNNQIVTFRLNYIAEKIAETQKVEAGATAKAEAAATANKAAAAAVPKLEIALVDAGAEPRKALRYHPRAGDKQTVVATMIKSMDIESEGEEAQSMKSPGIKTTTEFTVKEVSSNGDITYEAVLNDLGLVAEGDLGADADKLKASLGVAKGVMNIVTVSDRGIPKSSRMAAPPDSDPKISKAVDQMKELFPDLLANLPDEAIGVGAKWTITEKSMMEGMSVVQTTTAELVSIDGDVATVKLTQTVSAPPQTISSPAMPALKLNLKHLAGKGGGNMTFSLAQTQPSKGDMNQSTEYTVEMNRGGQKKSMTMRMESGVSVETK